jgi:molybdate transport system substrate-binding protein
LCVDWWRKPLGYAHTPLVSGLDGLALPVWGKFRALMHMFYPSAMTALAPSTTRPWVSVALAWSLMFGGASVRAEEVHVAVAANFAGTFQKLTEAFQSDTGHMVLSSVGATGKFYQQIKAGAPFDVLLAADDETPKKLEDEGLAVKGQRFTYAKGKLVLWSAKPEFIDAKGEVLIKGSFERLALADPKLAPYGAASMEAMGKLGLLDKLKPKFVQGESIGQAYQFIATGNAELGFVALSQVAAPGKANTGSWWVLPASLYTPLLQDATLLKQAEGKVAAKALLAYLKGDKARAIIKAHGYEL